MMSMSDTSTRLKFIRKKLKIQIIINLCMYNVTLTLEPISSAMAMQNLHFLKAEARALYPPRDQLARLSAHTTLIVPRKLCCSPCIAILMPSSYSTKILIIVPNNITSSSFITLFINGSNTLSIPYFWSTE